MATFLIWRVLLNITLPIFLDNLKKNQWKFFWCTFSPPSPHKIATSEGPFPRSMPTNSLSGLTKSLFTVNSILLQLALLSHLLLCFCHTSKSHLGTHLGMFQLLTAVTPLPKKPSSDATCPVNYRPISNLHLVAKVMEKVLTALHWSSLSNKDLLKLLTELITPTFSLSFISYR